MCVGIPAKIVKFTEDGQALVDAGGAQLTVVVELLSDLQLDDYVLVHAGVAIAKISATEAEETQALLEEVYGYKD